MTATFFIKYASYIISTIALLLNLIGYLAEQYLHNGVTLWIWLTIAIFDMLLA